MQKSLERQAGVAKVLVSLRDGTAEVDPKEDGEIDPRELLESTYVSGVSVAEIDVKVTGLVIRAAEGLSLQYAPGRSFNISPNKLSAEIESLAGTSTAITVKGRLFEKSQGKKKKDIPKELKLFILEIQKKE
ncbi:MAG: hypothetical protein ACRD8A_15010 [Candidatus Acidiferrales bacterium]